MRFLLLTLTATLSVGLGLAETTTGVGSYSARNHDGHVTNPANDSSVVARVNDRCSFVKGRVPLELGFAKQRATKVRIEQVQ